MLTLWDLLKPRRGRGRKAPGVRRPPRPPAAKSRRPMAEVYERMTQQMLAEHGVRVRKWRTSMSGVAWQVSYRDGTTSRLIEAPRPRGPMSAAVFLHEIGHHAIGLGRYRPRCLEEYHAWRWSIEVMQRHGINVTEGVRRRMHESLHYALAKAIRRGLKRVPTELEAFRAPLLAPSRE